MGACMRLAQATYRGPRLTQRELEARWKAFQRGENEDFTVINWNFADRLRLSKLKIGKGGLVKLCAAPGRIMLDIDQRKAPQYWPIFARLRHLNLSPEYLRIDRTRHGWHVIVQLKEKLSPAVTVALQCILGSDLKREQWNLFRVMSGKAERNNRWNMLFEERLK